MFSSLSQWLYRVFFFRREFKIELLDSVPKSLSLIFSLASDSVASHLTYLNLVFLLC